MHRQKRDFFFMGGSFLGGNSVVRRAVCLFGRNWLARRSGWGGETGAADDGNCVRLQGGKAGRFGQVGNPTCVVPGRGIAGLV